MENKKTHLEMIQDIISRMANNSFLLKAWSVTIISALCVLLAYGKLSVMAVMFIPLVCFWSLDGYFLRQERLYRKLYDAVRIKREDEIDFSMNATAFNNQVDSWVKTCISITLVIFYGAIAATTIVIIVAKYLF
jgi:hypothetical protein